LNVDSYTLMVLTITTYLGSRNNGDPEGECKTGVAGTKYLIHENTIDTDVVTAGHLQARPTIGGYVHREKEVNIRLTAADWIDTEMPPSRKKGTIIEKNEIIKYFLPSFPHNRGPPGRSEMIDDWCRYHKFRFRCPDTRHHTYSHLP
jgi:hypothetical protein